MIIPHDQFDHVVETLPKVREAEENLTRQVRLGLDNIEEVRTLARLRPHRAHRLTFDKHQARLLERYL